MSTYPYEIPVCKNCGDEPLRLRTCGTSVPTDFMCANDWCPAFAVGTMSGVKWIELNKPDTYVSPLENTAPTVNP